MSLSDSKIGIFIPRLGLVARGIAGLQGWRRSAVGFTLGVSSILAFAPFHIWPLLFLTFPGLIWLLDGIANQTEATANKPPWRQAAVVGWWFGFGFFISGLYWLGFAFFVEAEKFAFLAPLGVAALPAALAIFPAAASAAAVALWPPGAGRIFVFATAFFAADWLRGHMLTGFPWNLWGYALAGNDALAQNASVVGIYGLTFLALLIFASPAALAGTPKRDGMRVWPLPAICFGLLIVGWGWGVARLTGATGETVPNVQLRIVQANIPQSQKWKPESRDWIFQRYLDLSRRPREEEGGVGKASHLIWPESSVPFLFGINDQILFTETRETFARLVPEGSWFILGAERAEGTERPDGRYNVDRVFNSLFVLDSDARILSIYDKLHLVPFGEYIPFEPILTAIGLKQLTHMNTGFASGAVRRPLQTPGAPAFSPLICYEIIFPGRVAGKGERPGWILNLTNDAWFGTSTGPYQHLHQARLRAIEEGLPLIRAANTGVSAVIDAHGRVLASLPLNEMGILDQPLPVALLPTAYARWGEIWLILVAFLIFILYRVVIEVE